MLSPLTAALLVSLLSQPSVAPPLDDDCAGLRRLDLSLPVLIPPRICVSPGLLTGLLFDGPVDVDIQEEIRFAQVIRGRESIGFVPPRDMLPGEQLRLTAVLGSGEPRQHLTFALVAHPGQASHQVEVNHTERSRQDLSDALGQALLANRGMSEALTALQAETHKTKAQPDTFVGLRSAYLGGQLGEHGIMARRLDHPQTSGGVLEADKAVTYQGVSNIAVMVVLKNRSQESWRLEEATLVTAKGETLRAVGFWQPHALMPGEEMNVFVEFGFTDAALEGMTLTLTGSGKRVLSLFNVVFP